MIINNGKIVASDTTRHLQEGVEKDTQIVRFKGDEDKAIEILEACTNVKTVENEPCDEENCAQLRVTMEGDCDGRSEILKALVDAGIEVLMLKPASYSLEEAFLKIISGEYDAPIVNDTEDEASDEATEDTAETIDGEAYALETTDTTENEEVETETVETTDAAETGEATESEDD
jgi:hypothetical protein